jgi:hypothetical protein
MKPYILGLLAVVALVMGIGVSAPKPTQAAPSGSIKIGQTNVQLAINFALYCLDTNMNTVQGAVNAVIIDAPDTDVDKIKARQTNVQIAYNFVINSQGVTQDIVQTAGNTGVVMAGSAATDISVVQDNLGNEINFTFQSIASPQSISRAALNQMSVTTGSPTMTSALSVVIKQLNLQLSLAVCAPEPVLNQVTGWTAYTFGGVYAPVLVGPD